MSQPNGGQDVFRGMPVALTNCLTAIPLSMDALSAIEIERVDAPVRRQVEGALRQAIVGGRFAPGQRLIESQLCKSLRVSRPIVREALRQLVAEGLVVIVPHHGARVASITADEARQIYEVRAYLEALAGQGFVRHADSSATKQLRLIVAELEQAVAAQARGQSLLAIKRRFYAVLLEHCGNGIVSETLERLNNRISQLRALSLSQPGRPQQTLQEIKRILKAIDAHDSDAAFRACALHVEQAAEYVMKALKAREGRDDSYDYDTPALRGNHDR